MIMRKLVIATAVVSFALVPVEALAKVKPTAPKGEARAK